MQNNRILIVSNFFYPEITPRAFRVKELAIAFCKKGYRVDVLLPNKEIYKQNSIGYIKGLTILYSDEPIIKTQSNKKSEIGNKKSTLELRDSGLMKLKKCFFYFFPREIYQTYNKGITKVLVNNKIKYKAVISISHPLSIHIAVMIGILLNKNIKKSVAIAEFSDPLFKGKLSSVFPTNHLFGFFFACCFDHFVVPIEQAKVKFNLFKKKNISVIPQGFDFSNIIIKEYLKNEVPIFAYAGSFYEKLRDPTYFLEALTTIDKNFLFILYLSSKNTVYRTLIEHYEDKIKGKIKILDFIPREDLINELSTVDFLVNFDNENQSMNPSKLIDYALTKRPILSFNSTNFNINTFISFLDGKYNGAIDVDINNYSIDRVSNKYKKLIENENP